MLRLLITAVILFRVAHANIVLPAANGNADLFQNRTETEAVFSWYDLDRDKTVKFEIPLMEITGLDSVKSLRRRDGHEGDGHAHDDHGIEGVISQFALEQTTQPPVAASTVWVPMFACDQPEEITSELMTKAEELGADAIIIYPGTSGRLMCMIEIEGALPSIPIYTTVENDARMVAPFLAFMNNTLANATDDFVKSFNGTYVDEVWPIAQRTIEELNADRDIKDNSAPAIIVRLEPEASTGSTTPVIPPTGTGAITPLGTSSQPRRLGTGGSMRSTAADSKLIVGCAIAALIHAVL